MHRSLLKCIAKNWQYKFPASLTTSCSIRNQIVHPQSISYTVSNAIVLPMLLYFVSRCLLDLKLVLSLDRKNDTSRRINVNIYYLRIIFFVFNNPFWWWVNYGLCIQNFSGSFEYRTKIYYTDKIVQRFYNIMDISMIKT